MLTQVAQGVIGTGLGLAASQVQAQTNWEYKQKEMEKGFELNEKAAENAYEREKDFYKMTYDMNSYEAMRDQMERAGLSPALMYADGAGGAGGQGGAAPQGGAGTASNTMSPVTVDPLMLAQLGNINADTEAKKKQAELTDKEKELKEAEAGKTKEEANYINRTTEIIREKIRQEAIQVWYANVLEKHIWGNWDLANQTIGDDKVREWKSVNKVLEDEITLNEQTLKGKQVFQAAQHAYWQARGEQLDYNMKKVREEMTSKENANYTERFLAEMAMMKSDKEMQEATARKYAWEIGDYSNWKTYLNVGVDIVGAITDVVGLGMKGAIAKGLGKAAKNIGK